METVTQGDEAQARDVSRIALADDETDLVRAARKALDTLLDAKAFW